MHWGGVLGELGNSVCGVILWVKLLTVPWSPLLQAALYQDTQFQPLLEFWNIFNIVFPHSAFSCTCPAFQILHKPLELQLQGTHRKHLIVIHRYQYHFSLSWELPTSPHLWVQNVVLRVSLTTWNCSQASLLSKLSVQSRKTNKSILLDCPV